MPALNESDFASDPFVEFERWFADAGARSGQRNSNAMTLCTVGSDGAPQGRIVLLKGHGADGFRFFSNSESEKGLALAREQRAELVIHWDAIGRQVRLRGRVERLPDADADAYFASRPRGSQLAAWASEQSREVASRAVMDERYAAVEKRHADGPVPRPPYWWGYLLVPERMEFWQEAESRFHDRFVYWRAAAGWSLRRLNP